MLTGDTELTYAVIGQAMSVHRDLGPGVQECQYHALFSARLNDAELWHRFKPSGVLRHRGHRADEFEADLLFDGKLVVEVKSLDGEFARSHFAQILCYQKFWSIPVGLLIDFGKESLVHKRVIYSDRHPELPLLGDLTRAAPISCSNPVLITKLGEGLLRIASTYGLGYRDTTYRGLLVADLVADGIVHRLNPVVPVHCDGKSFGQSTLNCIVVDKECVVMVLALHQSIRASDRAILQTYLKLLNLSWGIIVNFGKQTFDYRYIVRSGGTHSQKCHHE